MASSQKNSAVVLRIGSRESELALRQTNIVKDMLTELHPEVKFEIITKKTKGDKILDVALSSIGSKSLFTRELETALENQEVDLVVHSLKDLPTTLPEGLVIGAVCEREDPRDVIVVKSGLKEQCISELPDGSVVGTSSLRRVAQLKKKFPSLVFESVRGNLNTRFRKLDEGDHYAAIILAAAGVKRMGWEKRISAYLDADDCMHAVGQGALAIECREDDQKVLHYLSAVNHVETAAVTIAERAFMCTLEGGCSVPVAVRSKIDASHLELQGGVWSLDGTEKLTGTKRISVQLTEASSPKQVKSSRLFCGFLPTDEKPVVFEKAYNLGVGLARLLLDKGAKRILDTARKTTARLIEEIKEKERIENSIE